MQLNKCIGILLGLTVLGTACAPAVEGSDEAVIQSTQQALGESVATNKGSYAFGEPVVISFAGLPGNAHDWITIAPAGAPNNDIRQWRYTAGRVSGSVSIPAPAPAGSYVARAFLDDGLTLLAESAAFTVVPSGTATTTTDKALYGTSDKIVVSYANLAGYAQDWVALAHVGAPPGSVVTWRYTGGGFNGSMSFAAPPPGQYVARTYLNNGMTIQAQSAPFEVAATTTVMSRKSAYFNDEVAVFDFAGMSGSGMDWIGIAPVGADAMGYKRWDYVASASGTKLMSLVAFEGTYVVRAYLNNSFAVAFESEPFTIQQRPMTSTDAGIPTLSVATDKAAYQDNELASVTFGGMSGAQSDWIAIAEVGSAADDYIRWIYTKGVTSGVQPFSLSYLDGTYVARAYFDDGFEIKAESAPFTVTHVR